MDGSQSTALAEAVARARQIAAKIGTTDSNPGKRPADSYSAEPEPKRQAVEDPIVAQLKALADQGQRQPNGAPGIPMAQSPGDLVEEFRIPDNLVGMVIGKGGEKIISIQAESSCKIQIAQDSGGLPDRQCTLSGAPQAIQHAKQLLIDIINRGRQATAPIDPTTLPPGTTVEEMSIPGLKAGLVIGKGGETIKRLQEEHNVKMVMIQDTNAPTAQSKPLRITGDARNVEAAKQQVLVLLASKDMEAPPKGFGDYGGQQRQMEGGGDFGGGPSDSLEIPVPNQMVGVVIGKGGEMIKKIQAETNVRVQFRKEDDMGPERMCMLSGPPQSVQQAANMINDLITETMQRDMGGNGGGGGGPRPGGRPGGGPPRGGGGFGGEDVHNFPVPNEKCGLVIGKGGENIKQISQTTGAFVEISRDRPPNPQEKLFTIRGQPDQIRHAIRMICERAGLPPPPGGPAGPGGPPGHGGPPGWGGPPQPGPQPGYGAPQGWGANYGEQKPQGYGQQDPWASYYGQQAQTQAAAPPAQAVVQPQPTAQPTAQPSIDPLTGQQDYTAAWAEYFRQQGMTDYANAIVQQSSAKQAAAVAGVPGVAAAPVAAAQAPAGYQYPGAAVAVSQAAPQYQQPAANAYAQSAYPGYPQQAYSQPQ